MDNRWKIAGAAGLGVVATLVAGGVAMAARDQGLGPLGYVDTNNDGKVTRAEWIAAANARFAKIDRNGDGTLIVGELPPPRAERRAGGRGHRRDHGYDRWDDDMPAAAPPAAAPPAVAPVTDQAPAVATNAAGT